MLDGASQVVSTTAEYATAPVSYAASYVRSSSFQKSKKGYHVHEDELDEGGNATKKKKNGVSMYK